MNINYTEKVRELIENKNLKYIILTMGCQLNENDSEKISGMVEEMGFTSTDKFEESNLIIFNTCCVRENAEERLFGKLGEIKKMKELYPHIQILPLDYDPDVSFANVENRLQMMIMNEKSRSVSANV